MLWHTIIAKCWLPKIVNTMYLTIIFHKYLIPITWNWTSKKPWIRQKKVHGQQLWISFVKIKHYITRYLTVDVIKCINLNIQMLPATNGLWGSKNITSINLLCLLIITHYSFIDHRSCTLCQMYVLHDSG